MNPYIMEVLLKERHREMLAEAERLRLIAEYEGTRMGVKEKVVKRIGEWFIIIGEKLTHRYDHKFEMPAPLHYGRMLIETVVTNYFYLSGR